MTDEELIVRLRNYGHVGTVLEAADRIEALVKERDDCAIYLKDGETPRQRMDRDHADVLSLMQLLSQEKSRAERLVEALRLARVHVVHSAKGLSVSRALTVIDALLAENERVKK